MSLLSKIREYRERRSERTIQVNEPEGFRLKRRLPGEASRTNSGEVDFRRGVVYNASDWKILMEIQHPEQKQIFAIGANYFYWCEKCRCTVYEEEISKLNPIILGGMYGTSIIKCCPFCATWGPDGRISDGTPLSPAKRGDKIRAHYRYTKDGEEGNWWAERWDE